MKKWRISLWLLTAALTIIAAAFVGVRFGIDVGRAQYHNGYIREIQLLASELARETSRDDFGKSRFLSEKMRALSLSAGDDTKFSAVLNANTWSEIEASGICIATDCYPNPD